jgi:hypothetical protein
MFPETTIVMIILTLGVGWLVDWLYLRWWGYRREMRGHNGA